MTSVERVEGSGAGDHHYQLIEFLVPNFDKSDKPKRSKTPKPPRTPKTPTTQRTPRNQSRVWIFFDKLDSNSAKCKLCHKIIKTCGNTSNLAKHIAVHEAAGHIESFIGDKTIHEDLKASLEAIQQKNTPSPAPKFTLAIPKQEIIETEPVTIQEIPVPKKPIIVKRLISFPVCDNLLTQKFQKITATPAKAKTPTVYKTIKKPHSVEKSRQTEITNSLLYYICADKVPLKSIEGRGFKKLMKSIIPAYAIPKINTIKKSIDEKYEALRSVYLNKFSKIAHITLSCDICNENVVEKYLAVTAHFIDSANLSSVCIAVDELPEHFDSDYITQKFKDILSNWNIEQSKIVTVVTDDNPEIVNSVMDCFGTNKHVPCFGYSLNLVVEKALNESSITAALDKIRCVVLWIRNNAEVCEKIKKQQTSAGREPKEILADASGRWNSIYHMLDRFMELAKILEDVLLLHYNVPEMPNKLELSNIKQLLMLLKPLEYMSREVSTDSYISISKIIPMMNCVTNEYNNVEFENEDIQTLKTEILLEIDKRFGQIELCSTIALATLLDPRFKNIHFKDQHVAARSLRTLIENRDSDTSADDDSDVSTETHEDHYDIWSYHKNFVHKQKLKDAVSITNNYQSHIYDEVTVYLDNPVSPLWTNPLTQWEEMKAVFPGLYKQAMKHLMIPATSVPGEYIFSKTGPVINQIRNTLLGRRISKIMFLGSCKEEDWS